MKKKKVVLFFTALLVVLGLASIHTQKADAASWGAKQVFTTPKRTRGTWYYKEYGRIKKVKVTAHTVNGLKLYKILKGKKADKIEDKFAADDEKSDYKLENKVSTSKLEAYTFKYRGVTGFNATGWLAGAGDGFYYVPVVRNIKGKKINALRIGEGAGNYFAYYAYKKASLAK